VTDPLAIEPLRLSFEVECSREHAFETWTRRIGTWWPKSHSVTGDTDLEIILEGRSGGRIFERTPGGVEHDWGEVTIWEPPGRLGYLWHLRRDRADATDVLITFTARDGETTTVEIEHTGWERLGAGGREWRDRNRGGWDSLLPHYREAVAAA
jgi:Activator of Hsp90 ATPase homolog 1-like protein